MDNPGTMTYQPSPECQELDEHQDIDRIPCSFEEFLWYDKVFENNPDTDPVTLGSGETQQKDLILENSALCFGVDFSTHSFVEFENSRIDDACKEGKCNGSCFPACTKRRFDKDCSDQVLFTIPEKNHVFTFLMPPNDTEQVLEQVQDSIRPDLLTSAGPIHNRDVEMLDLWASGMDDQEYQLDLKRCKPQAECGQSPALKLLRPENVAAYTENSELHSTISSEGFMIEGNRSLEGGMQTNAIDFIRAGATQWGFKPAIDLANSTSSPRASAPSGTGEGGPSLVQGFNASPDDGIKAASICGSNTQQVMLSTSRTSISGSNHATGNFGQVSYWCTFGSCNYERAADSRHDWKRHEETHKQKSMCMKCTTDQSYDHPNGGLACDFCWGAFLGLDALKQHIIQCSDAKDGARSFSRRDKLREHLRNYHRMTEGAKLEDELKWVFDIDDSWTRQCGLCGIYPNNWDARALHIERHFAKGKIKEMWRIPFQKHTGKKHHNTCRDSSSDDSDDEDHDQFDGQKKHRKGHHQRGKACGVPPSDANNNSGSTKNQGYGAPSGVKKCPVQPLPPTSSIYTSESECSGSTITQPQFKAVRKSTAEGKQTESPVRLDAKVRRPIEASKSSITQSRNSSYNLERYILADEQHERLLLGLGRRPLNVHIGTSQVRHQELQVPRTFQAKPMSVDTNVQQTLAAKCAVTTPALQASNRITVRNPKYPHPPTSATDSTVEKDDSTLTEPSIGERGLSDDLVSVYLNNPELLYTARRQSDSVGIVSTTSIIKSSPKVLFPALTCTTVTTCSSASSTNSRNIASSVSSLLSYHPGTFWQGMGFLDLTTAPFTYGYDLPCEFQILGCQIRFDPAYYEQWICHTESHFMGPLPQKAICLFCDDVSFESEDDAQSNWRRRMLHIRSHLRDFIPWERIRPDFWIIEQLRTNNAISIADYNQAIEYTERPRCEGLKPADFKTPEQLRDEENILREELEVIKEGQSLRKSRIQRLEDMSPSSSICSQKYRPGPSSIATSISSVCESHNSGAQVRKNVTHLQDNQATIISQTVNLPAEQASLDLLEALSTPDLDRSDVSSIVKGKMRTSSEQSLKRRPIIHKLNPLITSSASSRPSTIYSSSSVESDWDKGYNSVRSHYEDRRHRVPDNDDKYITTKYSKDGRVVVVNHQKAGYDKDEPRSAYARPEERESHRRWKNRSLR